MTGEQIHEYLRLAGRKPAELRKGGDRGRRVARSCPNAIDAERHGLAYPKPHAGAMMAEGFKNSEQRGRHIFDQL